MAQRSRAEFAANRLKAIEISGQLPLEFLCERYQNVAEEMPVRVQCAIAAAQYCHPKLKQIELNDNREERRPDEIRRDIDRLLERGGEVDVGGVVTGAGHLRSA